MTAARTPLRTGCRAAVLLALFGRAASDTAAAPGSVRDAILCEAKQRFSNIYEDRSYPLSDPRSKLDWPKSRDNVTLRITRRTYPCGGNNVPMTFGTFDVDGVDPLDVFNVLVDTAHQMKWDSLLSGEKELGKTEGQQARGVEERYDAKPFQDREVFEWQCFNATHDYKELWVAFSTEHNGDLHDMAQRADSVVAAQDCLAAYRVLAREGGGARVTFTTQVNAHPFFVTQGFIFNIMWTKTVDYINALREQARLRAKSRVAAGEVAKSSVSANELFDAAGAAAHCSDNDGGLSSLIQASEVVETKPKPFCSQDCWSAALQGSWTAPAFLLAGLLVVSASMGSVRRRRDARTESERGAETGHLLTA